MKTLKITIELEKAKVISTLECKGLTTIRKNGNSTRQINFAIDNLFKGYRIKVLDHYLNGENKNANFDLLENIISRILIETDIDIYKLDIDLNKCEIEII